MDHVDIKGLQKTSLIDFAPHIVSTVFLARCNFRCPFCHNPGIVEGFLSMDSISEASFFKHLEDRKGLIDGVCITGGEPTLYRHLPEFIKKIKEKGLIVKLDTNGTNPKMLNELIISGLLDYVAMDIKTSREKYPQATRSGIDISVIEESVNILKNGKIPYEFRTTAVPEFFTKDDAVKVCEWIKGAEAHYIQQFISSVSLLDKNLEKTKPYSLEELEELRKIMSLNVKKTGVRGA